MAKETGSDNCPFRVILNRDYGGLGVERAVFALEQNMIGKFQRTVDREQDFAGRSELDDGILNESAADAMGIGVAVPIDAAELDGNPHRAGFGKEPGQAAYYVLFERMSDCLVGHGVTSTPELEQPGSPALPGLKVRFESEMKSPPA